MNTMDEIYDALSDALGAHENEAHGSAVPAIRTLQHQRDDALLALKRIRDNAEILINDGEVKPTVRFNGGAPVSLCYLCRRVVGPEPNPVTAKAVICPEGVGCGTGMQHVELPEDRVIRLAEERRKREQEDG